MRRTALATVVVLASIWALPNAAAQEQPVRGTDRPGLWVDTKGKIVGPLVADYSVLMRRGSHVVVVYLGGDSDGNVLWPTENAFLVYAEPNCGGQAYVADNFTTFGGDTGVVISGPLDGQYTMFVGAATGERIAGQSMSFRSGECTYYAIEWFAYPVVATYDLSNFTPPFRLR